MRRSPLLLITALLIAGALAPVAAQADAPAKCPSEQSLMKSSATYSRSGYLCAQEDHSGSMSIGAGKTHSYNTGTNALYYPYYDCSDRTSSSVTIAHGLTFGSDSWTATNWLTPSNTRHWAAAVLWTYQGSGVSGLTKGCDVDSQTWDTPPVIYTRVFLTQSGLPKTAAAGTQYTITVTVSPTSYSGPVYLSDGGQYVAAANAASGTATLTWNPAILGSRGIKIVSPSTGGYAPGTVDTDAITVNVASGTGLAITGVTDNGDGTATAAVAASGDVTTGAVTLLNIVTNADGSITKTPVGQAAMSAGAANVTFRPTAGTAYTLVAVLGNPAVATSYSVAYPSSKRLRPISGGVLGSGLDGIPAHGAIATGATTVTRTQKVTSARTPLSVRCPSGTHAINADALTTGPVDAVEIRSYTNRGFEAVAPVQSIGQRLTGQLVCRAQGSTALIADRVGFGTIGRDTLTAEQAHVVLFGGPGADRLTGTRANDALWGGLGPDRLVLEGKDSVADGGPGADLVRADGRARTMLVGGLGRDTLIGGFGPSYINAQDGGPGDRVTCRSAATRVLVDAGDRVSGACTVIAG